VLFTYAKTIVQEVFYGLKWGVWLVTLLLSIGDKST